MRLIDMFRDVDSSIEANVDIMRKIYSQILSNKNGELGELISFKNYIIKDRGDLKTLCDYKIGESIRSLVRFSIIDILSGEK